MKCMLRSFQVLVAVLAVICSSRQGLGAGAMLDYQKSPSFVAAPVRPLTMLVLDNSGSMGWNAYGSGYDSGTTYYGYFKNDKRYSWSGYYWYEDSSGPYDGNYLNWYYTDRIDVAKKVLTGGKVGYRNGVKCLIGHNYYGAVKIEGPDPVGVLQRNASLAWGLAVYDDDNVGPNMREGGEVKKYIGTPTSEIIKAVNDLELAVYTPLAETLYTVLQYLRQDRTPYFVASSGEEHPTFNDPAPTGDGVYTADGAYTRSNEWDPFYNNDEKTMMPCAQASVILITDGDPTQDYNIPSPYRTAAPGGYSGTGNGNYVDDVAFWMHTHDIRTDPGMDGWQAVDLYGIFAFGGTAQTLVDAAIMGGFVDKNGDGRPNTVYEEAAAVPDAREWDFDGDGLPDNYATATSGGQLAAALEDMIAKVKQKVASGTAASVISSSRSGEGAIYQAVFYPKEVDNDGREVKWVGGVHSLWLDEYGNIREDCDAGDTPGTCSSPDKVLDLKTDLIVEFYTDHASGEARARLFKDVNGDGSYDNSGTCSVTGWLTQEECLANSGTWTFTSSDFVADNIKLSDLNYLWDAGAWLADASAAEKSSYSSTVAERYIFTQFDDVSGKPAKVEFTPGALAAALTSSQYLAYLNASSAAEADKIVNYIRGIDQSGFRSRHIDLDNDGVVEVWKLGDIVYSTPTVVARPAENYDQIYNDESYRQFRARYRYRRTMIYAGANDGGLHAFNGGYFDRKTKTFLKAPPIPPIAVPPATQAYATQYDLGAEMWEFIPRNLLPHLRWLTDPDYAHVPYVDLKPYVFDAKIFDPDQDHPAGWGTILVGGMRFGGGDLTIDTDGDGTPETTMRSAYFILDVTNPEKPPVVLAEFTDADLGFTVGSPTAIPMLRCDRYASSGSGVCPDNQTDATTWPMDWYLAFGSGPHDATSVQNAMLGRSDQTGRFYVLKLGGTGGSALPYAAGSGLLLNEPSLVAGYPKNVPLDFLKSFTSGIVGVDYDLDFRVDSLYAGVVADSDQIDHNLHGGGVYRLVVSDDLDPANWYLDTFYDAQQPVSDAPAVAFDGRRAWVYFGTGRLYDAVQDKPTTAQQSFYGLKERYDASGNMDLSQPNGGNLVDVSNVWVEDLTGNLSAPLVSTGGDTLTATTFRQLDNELASLDTSGVDKYHGWKIDFSISGERNLGQASILGDIVTFATYVPSTDICSSEGDSYLWVPFYRTGTAYRRSIIGTYSQGTQTAVLRRTYIGKGLVTTPNIHVGAESGSTSFIQTSTGAIKSIQQQNPGAAKSKVIAWRDLEE